jgi:hypothetical protein
MDALCQKPEIMVGPDALLVFGEEDLNHTRCAACGSLLFSVVRDDAHVHVAMGPLGWRLLTSGRFV